MLTDDHLRQFAADGYVLLPGVVDESFLSAADDEIDDLIARNPPPEGTTGHHSYWPTSGLLACDATLRESGALAIANELVAPHLLDYSVGQYIQVATNLPVWSHIPGGPHIDNHGPESTDEPGSFTLLAGVYLVDESRPASGNLWVWPGSHRAHQRLFQERGVNALLSTSGHSTLLDPPLELGEPIPILAERGDLLLAHFLLGHNTGGNETDRVRRILYFRLACEDHRSRWKETFVDPWTEYEPVRRVVVLG